jgi:hypothetical protein
MADAKTAVVELNKRLIQISERGTPSLFALGSGPEIRLVGAKSEGIQSIVLSVKSKARAKKIVAEKQRLGGSDSRRLWIAPSAVGGLKIALIED